MVKTIAIVLAGGLGKRMNSDLPKPAHKIGEKSMLQHVVDKLNRLNIEKMFIVFGQKGDMLKASVVHQDNMVWVHQDPQLGTGHAVQVAFTEIKKHYSDADLQVLVCNGDAPFIKDETLSKLQNTNQNNSATLLTCFVKNQHGYGRIERENEKFLRIVEEKDCTDEQRKINCINAGSYCFTFDALNNFIFTLTDNNAQKEFYLTDMFEILVNNKKSVGIVEIDDEVEIFNINNRSQLDEANELFIKLKMA